MQVAIAVKRDEIDVDFWRAVLGYLPMADDNAVDPLGHGSTVWMQEIHASKALRHAMHIDVSVAARKLRRGFKQRLPPADASWMTRTRRNIGLSLTAPATASASSRGRMAQREKGVRSR